MKRVLIAACVALALAGCATSGPDPAKTVYVLEGGLTAAMQVATTYAQLPSCGNGQPVVCSDPMTVVRMQAAANAAVTAVTTAQAAVTNGATSTSAQAQAVADATAAVATLASLTSTVRTK